MMNRSILVIVLAGFLIFGSCNKDLHKKYVGDYLVYKRIYSYGYEEYCGEQYNYERDTIITVSAGSSNKKLVVLGREVELNDEGFFTEYSNSDYHLRIWNDSIYSYERFGGIECGRYVKYNGNKIPD